MSNAMRPQVSVVIKSYNHAAFVGETIQSVLDQSFQDFEIVITDDGSTDNTPEVIRGFTDPRIHLQVLEQNRGISTAMNKTIARARGEFIAILNSDDFALPDRLATQVTFLRANPHIAAVFGLPRLVDEHGRPCKGFFDFTLPFSLPDFSARSWLKYFFFHGNCLCAPTAMIRRSVYRQVGDYDPRLTNLQDLDMWVRVCTGHAIHVMRDELTAYRIRDDNRNMSAPRRDTQLRGQFEFSRILQRYLAMSADFIGDIFSGELVANGISSDGPHELWLAELALTVPSPAHRLFALETLFEVAQHDQHMHRLRDLAGSVDLFGIMSAAERDTKIEALDRALAARDAKIEMLDQAVTARDAKIETLDQAVTARDAKIETLDQALTARDAKIETLDQALTARDAKIETLDQAVTTRDAKIEALDQAVTARDATIETLDQAVTAREAKIQTLDQALAERDKMIESFLLSRSWRYTAPLRWVHRLIAKWSESLVS